MARKSNKGGRPTSMTEAVVSKLEVAFSVGANVTEACLVAAISRDTYYDFIKKMPMIADRFKELQQKPILAAKKRVVDAIVEDNDTATARWYLERRCKDEYGQHQKLDMRIENKPPMTAGEVAEALNKLIEVSKQRKLAEEVEHVREQLVA
jgi:hypothetical protein